MTISESIRESMTKSSWIRKMFEEGIKLKAEFGEENVYDFSLGNPDVEPPQEFFNIIKRLSSEKKKGTHGYMPNAGFPDVREKLAQKVSADQGIETSKEYIIMSCGAAGGLNVALKTILNHGDEIIVPKPYFAEYGFYISNHGGKMVFADTNSNFSLNVENINNAITPKTKGILINTPNNPTGKVYSEKEIIALADLLKSYHKKGQTIYLISDEPYREIVYDGTYVPPILKHYDHSMSVTSYSKSLSIPGERIGYIAVNPKCDEVQTLLSGLILCTRILGYVNAPALMQRAVAELNSVKVDMEPYSKRRELLVNGLTSSGYSFAKPEGAFYIFCKSPSPDEIEFVKHLQTYNILAVPGTGFGAPGYFRIAYCVSEETIKKSLPQFDRAIKEFGKKQNA